LYLFKDTKVFTLKFLKLILKHFKWSRYYLYR